jgi:hypothetical protein
VVAKELVASAPKLGDRRFALAGDLDVEGGDGPAPVGEFERCAAGDHAFTLRRSRCGSLG